MPRSADQDKGRADRCRGQASDQPQNQGAYSRVGGLASIDDQYCLADYIFGMICNAINAFRELFAVNV